MSDAPDSAPPPVAAPVYMLNVLWFKKDGGARTYQRYAAAAAPILDELGARALPAFEPQMGVIGKWDPDLFFLVEWPDWQTFLSLQTHAGYQEIAHLREEALEKSLLIRCRRSELLNP